MPQLDETSKFVSSFFIIYFFFPSKSWLVDYELAKQEWDPYYILIPVCIGSKNHTQ